MSAPARPPARPLSRPHAHPAPPVPHFLKIDTMRALENALYSWAGTSIIISHDRRFLDRLATHILAFEDDSSVVWFEGSYSEYEADWRKRTGGADPSRVKYRRMATAA